VSFDIEKNPELIVFFGYKFNTIFYINKYVYW